MLNAMQIFYPHITAKKKHIILIYVYDFPQ
jgi:hypothetical protein